MPGEEAVNDLAANAAADDAANDDEVIVPGEDVADILRLGSSWAGHWSRLVISHRSRA